MEEMGRGGRGFSRKAAAGVGSADWLSASLGSWHVAGIWRGRSIKVWRWGWCGMQNGAQVIGLPEVRVCL